MKATERHVCELADFQAPEPFQCLYCGKLTNDRERLESEECPIRTRRQEIAELILSAPKFYRPC